MTHPLAEVKNLELHWTAKINYRLRVISFAIVFSAIAVNAWNKNYGPIAWSLISLHLLVYPHVMFWRARRSANSQRAEQENLMVDCFLFGGLLAGLGFPLSIGFNFYIASTLNITISRGSKGLLLSQLLFFSGAAIGVAIFGWQPSPDTEWGATLISLLGNTFYMASIGVAAFGRNLQLRKTRETLKQNEKTLKGQIEEIQSLQVKLDDEMEAKVEMRTKERLNAKNLQSLGSLVVGIAHEMNTPIGNALLVASALDDEVHTLIRQTADGKLRRAELDSSLDRADKSTKLILTALNRTAELIRSFKRVSVSRSNQDRKNFSLAQLANNSVKGQNMASSTQVVEYRVKVSPDIYLDSYPEPLAQVLEILLENARVHGLQGRSDGWVSLVAEPATTGRFKISISDNGQGISDAHLPKIFDPFFTTTLGRGGNGLGLSVAWNIVTGVLGGSLEVTSEPLIGTTFLLVIPKKAPSEDA